MKHRNVLVLCTGNSCRSQMVEGYLRKYLGDNWNVFSAGIEAHGVNSRAIAIMAEDDVDISRQTSNLVDEYSDIQLDYIITVCDNAKENCPYIASNAKRIHHNFPDPAKATGSEDHINAQFRYTRELCKSFCAQFAVENT